MQAAAHQDSGLALRALVRELRATWAASSS
jgi:hypothetical protein